jgi:hypothetical protein
VDAWDKEPDLEERHGGDRGDRIGRGKSEERKLK